MKDVISIIIPVYNASEYLRKCLDSVYNQTLIKNIEVIIINDGSTDNSLDIINEYKNKNNTKIISQDNHGLSYTRNVGLDVSRGNYVTFLDSDDYLKENSIEILYNAIKKNDTDLVIGRLTEINLETLVEKSYYSSKLIDDNDKFDLNSNPKIINSISVCAKLYKKSILDGIRFINGIKHEDNYFTLMVYNKCKNMSSVAQDVYYRTVHEGSIMTTLNIKALKDLLFNYEQFVIESKTGNKLFFDFFRKKSVNYALTRFDKSKRKEAMKLVREFFVKLNKLYNYKGIKLLVNNIKFNCYYLMALFYVIVRRK